MQNCHFETVLRMWTKPLIIDRYEIIYHLCVKEGECIKCHKSYFGQMANSFSVVKAGTTLHR